MDPKHKKLIKDHMNELVQGTTNFDILLSTLEIKEVFSRSHIEEIKKGASEEECKRRMYDMITRRGPKAFMHLYESLNENKMGPLARLLRRPRGWLKGNSQDEEAMDIGDGMNINLRRTSDDINLQVKNGYVLLVNLTYGKSLSSAEDINKLNNLWTNLGLKVDVVSDLTQQDLKEKLRDFRTFNGDTSVDCLIVYILCESKKVTDEDEVFVRTSDGKEIIYQELVEIYLGNRCPQLIDKHKIFFFHRVMTDREIKEKPQIFNLVQSDRALPQPLTTYIHLLYPLSKHALEASNFIEILCKMFYKFASTLDFDSIISKVSQEIPFPRENRGVETNLYFGPLR